MKLTDNTLEFTHEEFHTFIMQVLKKLPQSSFHTACVILHLTVCHENIPEISDIPLEKKEQIVKSYGEVLNKLHAESYAENWLVNNV